jgi:hypothetical protein
MVEIPQKKTSHLIIIILIYHFLRKVYNHFKYFLNFKK